MDPWIRITGWTLIHFVWQGGLLAVVTATALRLCRRSPSETRYAIACAGMLAMLASLGVTAALMSAPDLSQATVGREVPAVSGPDTTQTMPRTADHEAASFANRAAGTALAIDAWLPAVVWAWLAGVTLLLAKFGGASWRVRQLRIAAFAAAVSPWQDATERLAARLRVSVAFRVVESALVDAPSVIGAIRPVILLPVAAVTNLTPSQLEALLAHELAHIRRHDYGVNLVQTVAETLLFFHPGVWWVSSAIRETREHCCDDVAIDVCGQPMEYAAALTELASWRTRDTALSAAATGGPLLARVRRVLSLPDDRPRPIAGLVIVAGGMVLTAALVVHASSAAAGTGAEFPASAASEAPAPTVETPRPGVQVAPAPTTERRVRNTDHFEIYYEPDLDLHAERIGREAEHAYERVSGDLRHNLAFRVPIVLFRTTPELAATVRATEPDPAHLAAVNVAAGDRILLAVDRPADQWLGLITHEVAHIFGFDILPGLTTPSWILEGLAEYEHSAWDPSDLAALREVVRANALPTISGLSAAGSSVAPRLAGSVGHAVFDFVESRWGKPGVREFLFSLRQTTRNGGDPYQRPFQLTRDEFEQAFERYLQERFAGVADPSPSARFDGGTTIRIEGEITAISFPAPVGLACLELWVPTDGGSTQRWAVECGRDAEPEMMRALRPGDHVIMTGAPARAADAQRMLVHRIERPSNALARRPRIE
jgi:beta-lactamase regulating signal transducer with metallopeptidase domain